MEIPPNARSVIEAVVCPIHKEHPQVILGEDNVITLQCCCTEFKLQCFYILKIALQENGDNIFQKTI